MIKVGLLAYGAIGDEHNKAVLTTPVLTTVAVCDQKAERITAALPAGVLDALLLPENKATLAKILTYHVVSGMVMAADIKAGDVATVEGSTVKLSLMGGL